jgi:hypothetical protein
MLLSLSILNLARLDESSPQGETAPKINATFAPFAPHNRSSMTPAVAKERAWRIGRNSIEHPSVQLRVICL